MYAIRSYYVLTLQTTYGTFGVVLKDELTVTRLDDVTATVKADFTEQNVVFRITSYNVCYTKLLRYDCADAGLQTATRNIERQHSRAGFEPEYRGDAATESRYGEIENSRQLGARHTQGGKS